MRMHNFYYRTVEGTFTVWYVYVSKYQVGYPDALVRHQHTDLFSTSSCYNNATQIAATMPKRAIDVAPGSPLPTTPLTAPLRGPFVAVAVAMKALHDDSVAAGIVDVNCVADEP